MVLERHAKKYKHLIRTMLSQLVEHQNITTTKARAKHLRPYAQKLLIFAKRAEHGHTSPLNLLRGRVHTRKIQQKLLVDLIPRIKHLNGNLVEIKDLQTTRRGDNAPLVQIYIRGNQKTELEKKRNEELAKKSLLPSSKEFESKILLQEKEFLQKKMKQNPAMEAFFKQKLNQVAFRQELLQRNKKQPPKYSLLI